MSNQNNKQLMNYSSSSSSSASETEKNFDISSLFCWNFSGNEHLPDKESESSVMDSNRCFYLSGISHPASDAPKLTLERKFQNNCTYSNSEKESHKDQTEKPDIAGKKQARVWISQSVNQAFETDLLGVFKADILKECFPSKSNRKSGDNHIFKCLGYLGYLSHEAEIFALNQINRRIGLKMNSIQKKYHDVKFEEFKKVAFRWMKAMICGIQILIDNLPSKKSQAISKAIECYLFQAANDQKRKIHQGNFRTCKINYLEARDGILN